MFQAPINNLIIKVDTKYIKNVSDIVKLSYVHNADVNPLDCVNNMGDVVSLPKRITTEDVRYRGFSSKDNVHYKFHGLSGSFLLRFSIKNNPVTAIIMHHKSNSNVML